MKKYFIKLLFILIVVSFIGCEGDQNKIDILNEEDLYGHWILTSAKANRIIDYNNDGQENNDLIDDFDCFTIEFIFYEDGTFDEVRIDKVNLNNSTSCIQINLNGFWNLDKNSLKFTYANQNFVDEINEIFFINDRSFSLKRTFNDINGDFIANLKLAKTTN
jgi:hypothetical protein